ncbi:MAG: recombination mediator RecR [Patescibacteria group bacterium]
MKKKICDICSDKTRQNSIICVVAENSDIAPLEKSGAFKGMYHVLYGTLNPTEGTTPDKLNIHALEERIKNNKVNEIILAFNPTVEGETTNLYLTKLLKKYDIKITKLARGLPQGADLEYADEITLANAFHGRTKI